VLGFGPSPFVVLLASVLKPVDDTRMRGKFAKTLRERPAVQVHIAGRKAGLGTGPTPPRLWQHPIFSDSRLSLGRLVAQWRYWWLLLRLRPNMVIVHAPELLPLTMLWQWLASGRQFLYDIRENYALNIQTQQVYQGNVRRWLAAGIRWVEKHAAQRSAGLILAEASYATELPFLALLPANRVITLENKYQPDKQETLALWPRTRLLATEPLRLLYSGTISDLNGVWEAIGLTKALRNAWPGGAALTITGFCQQPGLLPQLEEAVAQNAAWLTLKGGAEPVPHSQIVAEIGRSHVGLLPYRPHPSTARCRPTKLFEYLAHGLPVITTPNPLWRELVLAHQAGLQLDFAAPIDGVALAAQLQAGNYYPNGAPKEVLWEAEGKKLWLLLDSIF
jgi:glycogen(starch) synthase